MFVVPEVYFVRTTQSVLQWPCAAWSFAEPRSMRWQTLHAKLGCEMVNRTVCSLIIGSGGARRNRDELDRGQLLVWCWSASLSVLCFLKVLLTCSVVELWICWIRMFIWYFTGFLKVLSGSRKNFSEKRYIKCFMLLNEVCLIQKCIKLAKSYSFWNNWKVHKNAGITLRRNFDHVQVTWTIFKKLELWK